MHRPHVQQEVPLRIITDSFIWYSYYTPSIILSRAKYNSGDCMVG